VGSADQGGRPPTPRGVFLLLGVLLLTLLAFGLLADHALVGQARVSRERAAARADETALLAARAVRATLAEIEQAVADGRPRADVAAARFALPPPLSLPLTPFAPYARRSRAELSRFLSSDGVTPSGLPEAVVARLLLGERAPVSGTQRAPDVAERLLSGELPVRPEDLPHLARRLGVGDDPRVGSLQEALRRIPPARQIPILPAFRRRLVASGNVEGCSRSASYALRYEVPVISLLRSADAAGHVALAGRPERAAASEGPAALGRSMTRVASVPDVDGLVLAVTTEVPGALRLAALRVVLLLCVVAGIVGLAAARRAFSKEARAVARERTFLTSVTHELRTPLAAIRLLGERLADGHGDAREYGALVAQESERLEGMVERVLAATRVDEAPRFGPVLPNELVRSAVDLMTPRAERRGVRIDWQTGDHLPEARWDADAVRRALVNLLDNAVKHGKEGGHVEVRVSVAGHQVRLAVQDDGPGIGRAHRSGIFRRFGRGATEAAGTGLGLYLVEQVAHAHGGQVDLATEEGRGATFTLVLPLLPPSAGVQAATQVQS
jgi:signal transduction histidine kinase